MTRKAQLAIVKIGRLVANIFLIQSFVVAMFTDAVRFPLLTVAAFVLAAAASWAMSKVAQGILQRDGDRTIGAQS